MFTHNCDAGDFDGGDVRVALVGVYDHWTRTEVFSHISGSAVHWVVRCVCHVCHIHGSYISVGNLPLSHEFPVGLLHRCYFL